MTEQIIEKAVESAVEVPEASGVAQELAIEAVSKLPNKKILIGVAIGAAVIGLGAYIGYQRYKNGKSQEEKLSKKGEAIDVEYEERED